MLTSLLRRLRRLTMSNGQTSLKHLRGAVDELIEVLPTCNDGLRDSVKSVIRQLMALEAMFPAQDATPLVQQAQPPQSRKSDASPPANPADQLVDPPRRVAPSDMLARTQFTRLGIGDAGIEALKICRKEMTCSEIWGVMQEAGFPPPKKEPAAAISAAFFRKIKESPKADVICVGRGFWGLREWYTPDQIAVIERLRGGQPSRDSASHSASVTEGMQRARDRGLRIGREPKLDARKVAKIKALRAAGASIKEVCGAVGVSPSTYVTYRTKIEAWNDGDPWPPQPSSNSDGQHNVVPFGARK